MPADPTLFGQTPGQPPTAPTSLPLNQQTGLDILDKAILATGQINILIPAAAFAIKTLYNLMKRENPSLTPQQFYEYLRTEGREVKAFSKEWLEARGYKQLADGSWQAPATPSLQ